MTNQSTPARSTRLRGAGVRAWAQALRRLAPAAMVTLAAAVALTALAAAPPADAAAKQQRPARPTAAAAPRQAGEPVMAIVSIKSQQVTFYDADGWILRAPVSSGTTGRETPAGVFAIVDKDKDHHSSLYDDAWMPNMQRVTWSGIALHGGPLPGYAASHGCVRMPYEFAEKLFDTTHIGMRVIIAPGDAEPVAFSHPSLFVPKQEKIDAAPARADALARQADDATEAAAAAKTTVAIAKREAASASVAVPKLERLESRADAELARAEKVLAAAKTDQARAMADDVRQKASAKFEALRTQLEAAAADQKAKQDAVAAAQAAAKTAEARRADAAKAAKEAKLALEPVSIFISRATQKLYVRRPTHEPLPDGGEMFDASLEVPLTIRDPDTPIGTHVFTAVARTGGGLRWTSVTIDNGGDAQDSAKDSATRALDRITFPQEIIDRVAPTAVPGSSIIISDEPLNRETNYRTEFVVVLNNQPQGGLAMRKRPDPAQVARRWDDGFFGFNPFRDRNAQYGAARERAGQSYYPPQQRSW